MTELAALHVRLTGDSGGLVSAVNSADGAITSFGRVTTAAEANARGFDRALRNAGGGATSLQQRINSLTGVMGGSRRSAEASARAFDGLGDEALQSAAQMASAARQAQAYGTQATSAAMHTGNLAAQFNDIGVMLAAGQNPLQLALQQGTQINQVFGQMGAGASRLRMLGSALVSIISPANLVTIGLIAGGAALFQFGMNALSSRDKAASLADTLSTLDEIQGNLSDANEILALTTEELTEKYGQFADEVREAAKSLASLAEAQAIQAMGAALADLGNEFGRLTSSGRTFDTAMTVALERIQEQFKVGYREAQALNEAFVQLETATTFEQQVEALRNIEDVMAQAGANAADLPPELLTALQQLNLMVIAASSVKDGIKDAAAASGELATSIVAEINRDLDNQITLLGMINQFGEDSVEVERMRRKLAREEYENRLKLQGITGDELDSLMAKYTLQENLTAEAKKTSDAIAEVQSANLGSFQAQVNMLAHTLGIAADEAKRILTNLPVGMNFGDFGALSGMSSDQLIFGGQPGDIPEDENTNINDSSLANQIERDLEQLREGFMSQEELQIAAYESQQEILRSALEQRLITQQEYNSLMEQSQQSHVDAMNTIDQARMNNVLNGFKGMFGDLSSLMNTENKRMFQIGKAAAVAEAVVTGYQAAVSAWGQGMKIGGPPVAAAFTAASLAKTGALIGKISSQNFGGGGSQSNVGGSGGSMAAGSAPSRSSSNVALQLVGGDMFSRDQVIGLINAINEAQEDGAVVRLV